MIQKSETNNKDYIFTMRWYMSETKMIQKSETNNAIICRLQNVRKHPNADRLKLATVLGTQVIVGLDAQENDLVLYFDSNLRLSHEYLHNNNLYSSKEMNKNPETKGYFGKSGRVRAQKFRGEISNGYVAELNSLDFTTLPPNTCISTGVELKEGDEFTHIDGVEICSKYILPACILIQKAREVKRKSILFHRHWDTKQLMRQLGDIPNDARCWIEEKIHGTSGRTAHLLCKTFRSWWKFWKPKEAWQIVSGTRRMDNVEGHLPEIRKEIERRVVPHLHKGEEIYYEIYGYDISGQCIQSGSPYNCRPGEFKVLLYRVTITTPDGFCIDLDRDDVYRRASELGFEKPHLFVVCNGVDVVEEVKKYYNGKSSLDVGTLKEGNVVWFKNNDGKWEALKHKNEEFLIGQDEQAEKNLNDVEDSL